MAEARSYVDRYWHPVTAVWRRSVVELKVTIILYILSAHDVLLRFETA